MTTDRPSTERPWRHFADSYYAATDVPRRVERELDGLRARFAPMYRVADPAADPLAAAIIDRRIARSDFDTAVANGIDAVADAPAELRAFLDSVDGVASVLDLDAVARGAGVFRRLPPIVSVIHGAIAGFTYAAIMPNSAIALSLNRRMVEATRRRYIETAKYVADSVSRDGQDRFSAAFTTACRVRLVHAFVRTEIERHVDWNTDAYAPPINMAAVQVAAAVSGSWVVPFAEQRGYRFSPAQKDDLAAFTAYSAFLQGVPAEHLLSTHDALSEFVYLYLLDSPVPLPEDRAAAMSVLGPLVTNGYPISANTTVARLFNQYLLAETRSAFGDGLSDDWSIPAARTGRALMPVVGVANLLLSTMQRVPALEQAYRRINERYWEVAVPTMLERLTGSTHTSFDDAARVVA